MATLTIAHPEHTKTVTLGTTVSRIEISRDVAQAIQALYLTCSSEVRFQRAATAIADGVAAPTSDFDVIAADTKTPIGIYPKGGATVITVWVTAGTPTLHVSPYPVTAA